MSTRVPCVESGASRPPCRFFASLMQPVFTMLLLCAAAPDAVQAAVSAPKHLISPDTPRIEDPDNLIHHYLQAVDRGELVIFGHKLDRSMIVPVRIEYVYELSSRTTRIKVHANLKVPLPVPGQGDCQILAVGAFMEDGHIVEIESHVWVK